MYDRIHYKKKKEEKKNSFAFIFGEGHGNTLQYCCLENSMDGEAWWAIVHGVAKIQTRLNDFTSLHFITILIVALDLFLYNFT